MNRLLPAALLVLLGTFAASIPLRADDDTTARKAAADELLKVMHSERVIDRAADQMGQLADRISPPGRSLAATPAEDAAFRESLRQQARDVFKEQLKWETLQPIYAQLYVDIFTEPEIRELIAFYQTPVGQKLIDKQPELAGKFSKVTQQKAMAALPIVTQQLRTSVQKYRDAHPMPSPAVLPSPAAAASQPVPAPSAPPK